MISDRQPEPGEDPQHQQRGVNVHEPLRRWKWWLVDDCASLYQSERIREFALAVFAALIRLRGMRRTEWQSAPSARGGRWLIAFGAELTKLLLSVHRGDGTRSSMSDARSTARVADFIPHQQGFRATSA